MTGQTNNLDFFEHADAGSSHPLHPLRTAPLAARMRPRNLDDFVGQEHLLGKGKLLRRVIESDRLTSIILYGPPGCGKTSLAEVIATATKQRFVRTSGVLANVATLRNICETAKITAAQKGTILFVDEIHRFSKSQQDVLLPYVEDGVVTLIGATTHNPAVFVNAPLTSRSLVFELHPLDKDAITKLTEQTLLDQERGLGGLNCSMDPEAVEFLAIYSEGDARRALTALELAAISTPPGSDGTRHLSQQVVEECAQRKIILYDKDEDGHYDTISAFIKSVRGSDPDAAIYWLAKMLEAGEDPRFIVRRLIILASEDIGNADPRGLTLAVAAMQAVEYIGMPEARITLAQITTYLATAPKSNSAIAAIDKALSDVRTGRVQVVPEHLKNLKVKSADPATQPQSYKNPHHDPAAARDQQYILSEQKYYTPAGQGYEATIKKRMEQRAK